MDAARAGVRAYKKMNPDKVRAWAANRRAKSGKLPASHVKTLHALQRGKCAICNAKLGREYHLDHIYPLAKGGSGEKTNFQILCRPCNLKKAAKDPVDFMQSLGRLL